MLQALRAIPLVLLLAGCNSGTDTPAASAVAAALPTPAAAPAGSLLRMRIDGVEWVADREVSAMVYPTGYDRAVLINGAFGSNAAEQDVGILLNGVDGPGIVSVKRGNASGSVAQIGNLSPERYLIGGLMLDYDLQVDIRVLQPNPVAVEATFRGTMTANDGAVLKIEDGEFRYRE